MTEKNHMGSKKAKAAGMPRASVSFPPELYRTLEELAKKKKVSIAWVVREAAEQRGLLSIRSHMIERMVSIED